MHVLQVPAGNEGGPGGFTTLLRDEDGEEKKEDDDDVNEMEGRRRGEVDIQDSLVVQEGMLVKFSLVPVATFAATVSRFLPARILLNNHIVYIYKTQTA